MRLFFILLFIGFNGAYAQVASQVREIPDSCIFVRNATESTVQSVECLDNRFRAYMGCPIANFSITIYNRWGEVLFFSTDIEEIWYADNVQDGVYTWRVQGEMMENGQPIRVEKMGHVMVLR